MSRILDEILRASRPPVTRDGRVDERGTVPQYRTTAAPVTPATRVIELTRLIEQQRVLLAVAGIELQRWEQIDASRGAGIEREIRYHTFENTSFGGVSMAQHWCDLILWEAILNTNTQLHGIIEIGTWQGGFSRWLQAQATVRGLDFVTYDNEEPADWMTVPGYERCDVFAESERIEREIEQCGPVVLFCDGGNKPRELATFGHLVGPSGIVVVHDWGTETLPSDVPDDLEEIYGDYCDELGSISRVFRVKS